jgi:hypothetical protein
MKKLLIISLLISVTATAIFLQGCKKEAKNLSSYKAIGNTKNDSILVYNLLPDISNNNNEGYLLYLNDSLFTYVGQSEYYQDTYGAAPALTIPAQGGTFTIKLAAYAYPNPYAVPVIPAAPLKNPAASAIVCQTKITVPPHSGYGRLVFYDSVGTAAVKYMPISTANPGAPAPGTFKIRLINFGYPMPDNGPAYPANSSGQKYTVQMQYADSTSVPGNSNVPFGGVGTYQQIPYGTEQFLIYNSSNGVYINNSGVLNDVLSTFNLTANRLYVNDVSNFLFPSVGTFYEYGNQSTVEYGNIGSYPFAAGNCYTVMVIGNIYSVSIDRTYGAGTLDNFGQVQVVNTNPNQQDMDVKFVYQGGTTDVASLPFGQYTNPVIVPAGNVSITFSYQGKTVYSYNTQVPRLGNYTYYYCSDLTDIAFVLPESNTITALDYMYGSYYSPPVYQLSKVNFLDLCADAGNIFFTQQSATTGGLDVGVDQTTPNDPNNSDFVYKGYSGTAVNYDGTIPPTAFNVRLTASRPDSLAAKKVATLTPPFKAIPAPGTYTLVAAGLLNTTDQAKKIKLIMVKHTNFITKAK